MTVPRAHVPDAIRGGRVAGRPAFGRCRRALVVAGGLAALGACAGVPLRTMARLRAIRPEELLTTDVREFGVALDVDARVKPATGRSPTVDVALQPVDDGAFRPVVHALACEPEPTSAHDLGLPARRSGRHWLVYRLSEASARDLGQVQAAIRDARDRKRRGTLSIGVRNDWIAEVHPLAVGSEASTWMRIRRSDGFFELWTGRVPSLPARSVS